MKPFIASMIDSQNRFQNGLEKVVIVNVNKISVAGFPTWWVEAMSKNWLLRKLESSYCGNDGQRILKK